MADTALISGTLPGGPEFAALIAVDLIVLRVGDRVCIAGPRWLSPEQAARAAEALRAVTGG